MDNNEIKKGRVKNYIILINYSFSIHEVSSWDHISLLQILVISINVTTTKGLHHTHNRFLKYYTNCKSQKVHRKNIRKISKYYISKCWKLTLRQKALLGVYQNIRYNEYSNKEIRSLTNKKNCINKIVPPKKINSKKKPCKVEYLNWNSLYEDNLLTRTEWTSKKIHFDLDLWGN